MRRSQVRSSRGSRPRAYPSNYLTGQIGFGYNGTGAYGNLTVTGGTALRFFDLMQATGPVASPQAPPSSGSAWANQYYRDAWITLHATTITALSINSTAQNGLATSPASYTFLLPAAQSYIPTYTGTLTHTVTLL